MNAIQNITANNGWAMAITGYIIVLCGLAALSLIISQLHHIIGFFDKQQSKAPTQDNQSPTPISAPEEEIDPLIDLAATAFLYRQLTIDLEDSFPLSSLYALFRQENLVHPHLTIRALRENGFLIPVGDGLFGWKVD